MTAPPKAATAAAIEHTVLMLAEKLLIADTAIDHGSAYIVDHPGEHPDLSGSTLHRMRLAADPVARAFDTAERFIALAISRRDAARAKDDAIYNPSQKE